MKAIKRALVLYLFLAAALAAQPAAAPRKPKLVLAIVLDQFRYDYLTRFRGEYSGGLRRLLTQGAVFTNANYEHAPTVTAAGHSIFLSGAFPSVSGIIGNEWFDRVSGKRINCVFDDSVKLLGGSGEASSPRNLLVTTLGDELKIAHGEKSHVVGVSLKDRSAILPAGHMADGAFWFDARTGAVISSTYYFPDLPAWVKELNQARLAGQYAGIDWIGHKMLKPGDADFYLELQYTPFDNEMIETLAERAIAAERLGRHEAADLLTVSFSSNDYAGHRYGPDSPEVHDVSIRTDKLLEKLFRYVESQVGSGNMLVALTADHGVAAAPEVSVKRKTGGGRLPPLEMQAAIQTKLEERFGKEKWILSVAGAFDPRYYEYLNFYLDRDLIRRKNLDVALVERVAADAARAIPHIARVYTREQLLNGYAMNDMVGRRVQSGFHPVRGADVLLIPEPNWMFGLSGTTHGTPYDYDTHVPIIFMGAGIKPGKYNRAVAPNDIAPTLATMLEVEIPSGSSGRVLDEMLAAGF
jgi:predicted AlkP superfamily pyrophosphatase or phosphodiesterase